MPDSHTTHVGDVAGPVYTGSGDIVIHQPIVPLKGRVAARRAGQRRVAVGASAAGQGAAGTGSGVMGGEHQLKGARAQRRKGWSGFASSGVLVLMAQMALMALMARKLANLQVGE